MHLFTAFPVVVTSGALFRAYLHGSEMTVEHVDRAEAKVRIGARLEPTRCLVVTETALPQLLAEAAKMAAIVTVGA